MDLTPAADDLFTSYLAGFTALAGDVRSKRLLGETVRGIIGGESLCCARIAAFPPELAVTRHGERRVRRMLHGETTTRSTLDPDALMRRLQARAIEQLRAEPAIWVLVDGSALRKPHARAMAHLQRVKRRGGHGARRPDAECPWRGPAAARPPLAPPLQQHRPRV